MANIFDLFDPAHQPSVPRPEGDVLDAVQRAMEGGKGEAEAISATGDILAKAVGKHSQRILDTHSKRSKDAMGGLQSLVEGLRTAQAKGKLVWARGQHNQAPVRRAAAGIIPRFKAGHGKNGGMGGIY